MFYRNDEIPSNFNKIAEISDNFVVWVKETTLKSNTSYEAYIQFIKPSFSLIHTTNYKIKNGTDYTYNAHYSTNNMYSYLDYYTTDFELSTIQVDDDFISSDNESRSDCIDIFLGQVLCCVCFLWVFKQLSRLFFKGGLS